MTGAAPGFADEAGEDFRPPPARPASTQAVALAPACIPAHAPTLSYAKHQAGRPRFTTGAAADLGAFERMGTVDVAPAPPAAARLRATPQPCRGECTIEFTGGASPPAGSLTLHDARGRIVARLAATAPGRWRWTPPATLPAGVYLARIGGLTLGIVRAR